MLLLRPANHVTIDGQEPLLHKSPGSQCEHKLNDIFFASELVGVNSVQWLAA